VPELVAVNEPMVPVPLAPRPIAVLLLVQLYVAPPTDPLGVTAATVAPLHVTWVLKELTVGIGFTVTVILVAEPAQEPTVAVGVTA